MIFNSNFYPTTEHLAIRMVNKILWKRVRLVLEPSAGDGSLIHVIKKHVYGKTEIKAIEIENDLQGILRSKGINVIDTDFLKYEGLDQFDAIVANFPFSDGHKHLLKAIDILYCGQIVCLINAETLRNPYSNDRKLLVRKLEELNADIEFIENGFKDAVRKTNVDIALIYINIEKDIENDLLANTTDTGFEYTPEDIEFQNKDIAIKDTIEAIVREYNFKTRLGIDAIIGYYKNYRHLGNYMELITLDNTRDNGRTFTNACTNLTDKLKADTNQFIKNIRKDFWNKTLQLQEVKERLTRKTKDEFIVNLKSHENMEFTQSNVRQFMINLIGNYESILKNAIEEIFDTMTTKYAWNNSIFEKNIHYYNGWKTNKAFKVERRVILPDIGLSSTFGGDWYFPNSSRDEADDIDKVMNYFDVKHKRDYVKISDIANSNKDNSSKTNKNIFEKMHSEYFEIKFFKKGTCHLVFKDENILRAFNIEAGKRKGWLPQSYGTKSINELTYEEREIVNSFEENISDYEEGLTNKIDIASQLKLVA